MSRDQTSTLVLLALQHLRGRITCCPTESLHNCTRIILSGKTKTTQLNPAKCSSNSTVGKFEVPVNDSYLVEAELTEDDTSLILGKTTLLVK